MQGAAKLNTCGNCHHYDFAHNEEGQCQVKEFSGDTMKKCPCKLREAEPASFEVGFNPRFDLGVGGA